MQACILFVFTQHQPEESRPYNGPGMHKDCLAITQNAGRLLLHGHHYQHPSSRET